jgi:hypothetical protein
MDQFVLGYDRALPAGFVLSITGIYRTWKQFVESVAKNPDYTPVVGEVGVRDADGDIVSTGQTVTMYDWNNFDTDTLLVTNPSGLKRTYKGDHADRDKELPTQLVGHRLIRVLADPGNIDNVGFDGASDSGGQDAGPSPFLDTPNSKINWDGKLTHDPTHQIKLSGTYVIAPASLVADRRLELLHGRHLHEEEPVSSEQRRRRSADQRLPFVPTGGNRESSLLRGASR